MATRRDPNRLDSSVAHGAGLGVLALALGAGLVESVSAAREMKGSRRRRAGAASGQTRALHGAAALLGASVLADSAIEHYRGSYHNPGMFAPLVTAAGAVLSGVAGAVDPAHNRARRFAYASAGLIGLAGTAFHIYNIGKEPGGISWFSLFYAAPFGAPAALAMGGFFGLSAEAVARQSPRKARLLGLPAGRVLSALSAAALAGTSSEVALLHYRGAYHDRFMWVPVCVGPLAAALMAGATAGPPSGWRRRVLRAVLGITGAMGFAGLGFHVYGVSRNMGGWRNWSQNLQVGPPLPAPPSFTALAIAALTSLTFEEAGDG